jgi:hypothetical protein
MAATVFHCRPFVGRLALAADYSTDDLLPQITADTLVIRGRQVLAGGIAGVHSGDAAVVDALAFQSR